MSAMAPNPQPKRPAPRSCDECRTRKTKCDRGSPCSHCRAMNLTCRTTTERAKEPKDRIHVTKQYENKMDRMEGRLANIERLLEKMSGSTGSLTALNTPQTTTSVTAVMEDHHADHDESYVSVPSGNTGLQAESSVVKDAIDQAVSRDPVAQQDVPLGTALDSLKEIIARLQRDAGERELAAGDTHLKDLKVPEAEVRPTWEQVRPLLERYERRKPSRFNWVDDSLKQEFCQKCRAMFEQGQEGTLTSKLFVYSELAIICSEFSATSETPAVADHFHALFKSFSGLMMLVLSAYPLLSPPSLSAAEAITNAAGATIGLCKPSLTWDLLQAAARMCVALGYNRLAAVAALSDPLYVRKVTLFWAVYTLDRTTSLRLGRAPAISEDDIDVPATPATPGNPGLSLMLQFVADCARVQGNISSQLYGPRVRSLSADERVHAATAFAADLEAIYARQKQTVGDMAHVFAALDTDPTSEFLMAGVDMMHLSIRVMALNAIPHDHSARSKAVEAARDCLSAHVQVMEQYRDAVNVYAWQVFCHWALMHSPVTPFMVLVGETIAHPPPSVDDSPDLAILEAFTELLRRGVAVSEGIDRFHKLCTVFVRVARAYVTAKARGRDDSGVAIDESVAAVGFFAQVGALQPLDSTMQQHFGLQTPSLGDWYGGTTSLNELLEMDFGGLGSFPYE